MKVGWASARIGDIAELVTKGTTPTSVGFNFTEDGVNFVKVECINGTGNFIPGKFAKIGLDCHNALLRSQLKEGDLLFSIAGALGRAALVTAEILPANTNQALAIIRPEKTAAVDRRFLLYALSPSLIADQIDQFRGGVAQQNLSLAQVRDLCIPLPPLDEQKRIVAVLDEAFEGLSRARANAEANLADALELFEAGVGSAFNAKKIVEEGGNIFRLGDLADLTYGYTTKAHSEPTGPKFLRITDIQDGTVDWSRVPFCTEPPEDKERYKLVPGDIVFARTGATTGKSYLIWEEEDVVAASYLIRLRLKSPRVLPDFLAFFFQSDAYWAEIRAGISGSTQGGFNASKLGELQIHQVHHSA